VFAYNPDDAGYSWDAEKAEALRDKYSAIATHVEDLS
jgi:chromosome partitioning protein